MGSKSGAAALLTVTWLLGAVIAAHAWTPLSVADDYLVFMPGSQPGDVQGMDNASRCENCHAGYDQAVEPGSNWRGSMMAQAARDPLWLACLTVAAQDSIWALGNPNATDICIRCHSPGGWLEGDSDPTNTSALSGNQLEGVQCDFCHRMIDPLMVLGQPDVAPDSGTAATLAAQARAQTYVDLQRLRLFDRTTPFLNILNYYPTYYAFGFPGYSETGAGQYFVAQSSGPKWGPRPDTAARHQIEYSRFHKSREFCHSCHDVSNPMLQNLIAGLGTSAGTEQFAAASFFHVERTSSEFMLSAYGRGAGAAATGIPGVPWANKCQDCHMRDVTGKAADKSDVPVRADLALHDLTGGNTWVSGILASADTAYAGYDPYNYAILSGAKYAGASIDVMGLSRSGPHLARGQQRALEQLQMAATLSEAEDTAESVTIRITNNTGHKLISGFPEGRRMFLSIDWHDAEGNVIGTTNPYEPLQITRDGAGNALYVGGGTLTDPIEELVFEAKMSSSLTGEETTFHFALADERHKDNRIPPKGFDIGGAAARISQPRWQGQDAYDYFTSGEYAGGYHDVTIPKLAGAGGYSAKLFYQTTSKEYIEFLRDQANGSGDSLTLTSPTPSGEQNAYVVQTDPFFANLKGWGNAIWDLWLHNGGSAPVTMATLEGSIVPVDPLTIDIQHDAAGVVFDRWVTGYSDAYSGGGYVYGRWADTRLTARFTGSQVRWIGPKQPVYGMADVYIDGALVDTVDCYASAAEATLSATIWESDTLSDGYHTLEIRLAGQKNPASSGTVVVIDRFEVAGSAPKGGGVRFNERDGVFTGTWIDAMNPTYYGKTYAYSRWGTAAFTMTFEGRRVAWIGPLTPFYGMADVYLDGAKVATVDCYRPAQGWRERIWESGTLSPGAHTLQIWPAGIMNPDSTAANIVIDAIDVMP